MHFFVHGVDRPGAMALRGEHTEAHWTFMDDYADTMVARGPTLTDDGEHVTGSLHIVELPDEDAARAFRDGDPYYRAGVFADVLLLRWHNDLGRTMWDYQGRGDNPRFLVLGRGRTASSDLHDRMRVDQQAHLFGQHSSRLITHGPLLSLDGTEWLGTATLVESPDEAVAGELLSDSPYAAAGLYDERTVHRWRPGGRPTRVD